MQVAPTQHCAEISAQVRVQEKDKELKPSACVVFTSFLSPVCSKRSTFHEVSSVYPSIILI